MNANISKSILLFILICLFGCTHSYISQYGPESPDKKYKIFVICHGRSAHAYTDYTIKKVFIGIHKKNRSDDSLLFSKWVVLKATDLSWRFNWLDSSSIRIDFVEGKIASKVETDCGFLIIRKDNNTSEFKITEHSKNLKFKEKIYFF